MKTEQDIIDLRERILAELNKFTDRRGHTPASNMTNSGQLYWMAVGALAVANYALQLDRPENLDAMIEAMGLVNQIWEGKPNGDGSS